MSAMVRSKVWEFAKTNVFYLNLKSYLQLQTQKSAAFKDRSKERVYSNKREIRKPEMSITTLRIAGCEKNKANIADSQSSNRAS